MPRKKSSSTTIGQTAPRPFPWLGVWTLFVRENRRFLTMSATIFLSPAVSSLLYLAIFHLILGDHRTIGGVPYLDFLAPGLIMMNVIQNAFANGSTSLLISKLQGNIVDTLMAPLNAYELTLGYSLASVMRGMMVGVCVWIFLLPFVPLTVHHPLLTLLHLVNGALMMSLIGVMTGVWCDTFDRQTAVTNFVITPLVFLSGTFYSIHQLPPLAQDAIHLFNPLFYMIDGLRYGLLGISDTNPWVGIAYVGICNGILFLATVRLFASGYKLRF